MNRNEFDHLVRAAADIVGEDEFVIIGSQSILGVYPNPPSALLLSMEADMFPRTAPEKAIDIDGAIGDGSIFHVTYGYYAHGVGPKTMVGPKGWEERMIVSPVEARAGSNSIIHAYCPEIHDLVVAKCVANRERDWDFASKALAAGLVERPLLLDRATYLPVEQGSIEFIQARLKSI